MSWVWILVCSPEGVFAAPYNLHVRAMVYFLLNSPPPKVQEEEDNQPESEGDDPDNQEPNEDLEEAGAETNEGQEMEAAKEEEEDDEPGMWDEMFKTHRDSKPYGMGAVVIITCLHLLLEPGFKQ